MRAYGARHVGIVVKSLDQSKEFYETLGFTSEGKISHETGEALSKILSVKNAQIISEKFTLHVDPTKSLWREEGFRLELVQYLDDKEQSKKYRFKPKANSSTGRVHLCLTVFDIKNVLSRLQNAGFKVPKVPYLHNGNLMVYLDDPNGVAIELIQSEDL
jgi:catechol 2,3-dioxygenase-like lactoylglutathione lyase family enzyme